MKRCVCLLATFTLILVGCTTFQGIKPVFPEVGNPNFPKYADSIQPTLSWEPLSEKDVTYDLIIYEGIKDQSFWKGTRRALGPEVYYREGLIGSKHLVEMPLKPRTEYYWSVRIRRGNQVSNWSRYDYSLFLGTAYVHAGNRLFFFQTPGK